MIPESDSDYPSSIVKNIENTRLRGYFLLVHARLTKRMLFFRGRDQGLERHVAVCDNAFVRPDSYFAIHRENHARHTLMQVGVGHGSLSSTTLLCAMRFVGTCRRVMFVTFFEAQLVCVHFHLGKQICTLIFFYPEDASQTATIAENTTCKTSVSNL